MSYNDAIKLDNDLSKRNLFGIYNCHFPFEDDDEEDEAMPFYDRDANNGLILDGVDFLKMSLLKEARTDMLPLVTGNYYAVFDRENALDETSLDGKYPICICFSKKVGRNLAISEDGNVFLKEWAIVRNEDERKKFLSTKKKISNISYYSIQDDIYDDVYSTLKTIDEEFEKEYNRITMSPIHLEGDVLITDPCYWVKREDWGTLEFGNTWNHLGITKSICRDTMYGDWGCHVFDKDSKEVLGSFTADAGMVCVCLLDEVRAYSGSQIDHCLENGCAMVVKNFSGDVRFEVIDNSLSVIGEGNINFVSMQTGL